jgi:hypothetical protein
MKYAYSTKTFDNGNAVVGGVIAVPDTTKSTITETAQCTVYLDVFDTIEAARKNQKEDAKVAQ